MALPFEDASFRRRDHRLRDPERGRPRGGSRGAGARAPAGRPPRLSRDHAAARAPPSLLPPLVRRPHPARREDASGRGRLHLPPGERAPLPRPGRARGRDGARRASPTSPSGCSRAGSSRSTSVGVGERARDDPVRTGARAVSRASSELRLEQASRSRTPVSSATPAGTRSPRAASGLRPLLVFLTAPDRELHRALRGGVAVELVHMATLVHDDLIDRARSAAASPRCGPFTARKPPRRRATTSSRARSR